MLRSLEPMIAYKRFTKEEESSLFVRMKDGDSEARRLLIESQLALVRSIVVGWCLSRGLHDMDDVEAFARVQLVKIVDHEWQPSRAKLSTFLCRFLKYRLKFASGRVLFATTSLDGNDEVIDVVDATLGPREQFEINEDIGRVRVVLTKLSPRHLNVVEQRMAGRTLEEIGRDLRVSCERVRQIEAAAFKCFRRHWRECQSQL